MRTPGVSYGKVVSIREVSDNERQAAVEHRVAIFVGAALELIPSTFPLLARPRPRGTRSIPRNMVATTAGRTLRPLAPFTLHREIKLPPCCCVVSCV